MKTRRKFYEEKNPVKPRRKKRNGNDLIRSEENSTLNNADLNDNLDKLYHDIKSTPNYSSKIESFLRKNPTSSLHKSVRHKFPRRSILAFYPYELIMSDLIDFNLPGMPGANRNYRYIMVFVCVFSKMAWAEPLKRKDGLSSVAAIENVLRRMSDIPANIITDRGLEYYDRRVQELFRRNGIRHYSLRSKHKACVAERFIRTLKGRLYKYFWKKKTKNWIDVLQQLITNYNHTIHRSIKMAPIDVNENNRQEVFERLYPNRNLKSAPRLRVGDQVRILRQKTIFDKGYTRNWSLELYRIYEAKSKNNVDFYKIEDQNGVKLDGNRYYWELNLVSRE